MTAERELDWLKLILVPGLGPAGIQKLHGHFGEPGAILRASESQLRSAGLAPGATLRKTDNKRLQWACAWLEASANHHLLCIDDPRYPALLKTIHGPPPVLFVAGDISLPGKPQLAIVGSRNPTSTGRETAYEFACQLATTGLVITSGLALGIDGAGHRGALDAGGQSIAVAGNGLDQIYPARHTDLAHRIIEQGALISELPPGTKPLSKNFPRRNRIISGLSLGALIVEAAQKSGSLITAYKALEQSREVFAVPGSIHNPLARGCHQLIRQGAKLVETTQDILEELAPIAQASFELHTPTPTGRVDEAETDKSHQAILDAMAFDPVDIDALVRRTGMTVDVISSALLVLELEKKVSPQAGGRYIRK